MLCDARCRARRPFWDPTSSTPSGALWRVGIDGLGQTQLLTGLDSPGLLAAHDSTVVFVEKSTTGFDVMRTTIDGAAPSVVVSSGELNQSVAAITLDAANVYLVLASTYGTDFSNADGRVVSVPLFGGQMTILADGLSRPSALAIDGSDLYFATAGGYVNIPAGNAGIFSVATTGGAVTPLVTDRQPIDAISLNVTNAYWSELGSIFEIPK